MGVGNDPTGAVMKVSGVLMLVFAVLVAAAGVAAPIVGDGAALAALAATDTRTVSVGTLDQSLNQERFINNPDDPYDTDIPVESVRRTVADPAAAAESPVDGVVVFGTQAQLSRTDTETELSSTGARYAFNGLDSALVDCCGANLDGSTEVSFSGLMPLKFPFATQARDYQMFSPQLRLSFPAAFEQEVNAYGLTLMQFRQQIPPTQTASVPFTLPASLAAGLIGRLAPEQVDQLPASGNVDLFEFYTSDVTALVEPATGAIVDTVVKDRISYRLNGGDVDIVTKSAMTLRTQDPAAIADSVRSQAAELHRYEIARPILLGIAAVLGIGGAVLLVRARNKPV